MFFEHGGSLASSRNDSGYSVWIQGVWSKGEIGEGGPPEFGSEGRQGRSKWRQFKAVDIGWCNLIAFIHDQPQELHQANHCHTFDDF